MYHKPKIPDHQIVQKVTTQLPRRGIRPPCNVRVHVRNGTVTLSGTIEFEMQRKGRLACGHERQWGATGYRSTDGDAKHNRWLAYADCRHAVEARADTASLRAVESGSRSSGTGCLLRGDDCDRFEWRK